MNRAPLSPAAALVAHIEPFITDRRVLVVGKAGGSLAEDLLDRGARLVQVLDPDPKRVAQAASLNQERRISLAPLTENSLRDASADCTIVEDVSGSRDLDRLVTILHRSMNNRSIAIFCASNPDAHTGLLGARNTGVDYDELYEKAESCFESVWMLGQSPFVGYSVVQLDLEHPPEPALDNAYLSGEGETPDFYLALCGTEETLSSLSLEDMTIVQLPARRFMEDSAQLNQDRERRANKRAESLESEIKSLRGKSQEALVDKLTRELEQRDAWILELEARSESADARADDAESDCEELEQELETTHKSFVRERERATQVTRLEQDLDGLRKKAEEGAHHEAGRQALEVELNTLDEKRASLESALSDKKRAQAKLEKRLAEQELELDDLHDQLDEAEDRLKRSESSGPTLKEVERDLHGLENQLQKRGHRVSELEQQLKKLETYAKTLSAELDAQEPAAEAAGDAQESVFLAKALAEREADLVACQWTIGQLQQAAQKS